MVNLITTVVLNLSNGKETIAYSLQTDHGETSCSPEDAILLRSALRAPSREDGHIGSCEYPLKDCTC
jgi:hypothetical protein